MNNIVRFYRPVQTRLVRLVYFMRDGEVRKTTPLPLNKAHNAIDIYEMHLPVSRVEIEELDPESYC